MNLIENLSYLKYFGFNITFWKSMNRIFQDSKNGLSWRIHDINNNIIEKYIIDACPQTYSKLVNGYYDNENANLDSYINPNITLNNTIWTMWWQGEENAPLVIKECIRSMRLHSNGHPVVVLSEDNYMDYVQLPKNILQCFYDSINDRTSLSKCTLDKTKLSDFIRLYLLSNYGGVWADASILFTNDLDDIFFENNWGTLGQDNKWYIGRGKWSAFFMSSHRGNGFCRFCYDMHVEYWNSERYWVNYLMIDHIFDIAYKERNYFKEMVDRSDCGNKKCLTVNRLYNKKCNVEEAINLMKKQSFHKLSWKWGITNKNDLITDNGEYTWLGYFLENYKNN